EDWDWGEDDEDGEELETSGEDDDDPGIPLSRIEGSKAAMDEAVKWCGAAASRGDGVSQHRLGVLYGRGSTDVKPDPAEAYFWLSMQKSKNDFRDAVAKQLTAEQRTEIEGRAKAWKPEKKRPPAGSPFP
ncbi:MAG: hypothetical protein ABR599_03995, partial [Gemmatimonadota bacterium]